uniref:Uncharacterized protein n=1 Tax=Arundo donax TaxID=35708 RepID=A0A0A8Y587_ARUDO
MDPTSSWHASIVTILHVSQQLQTVHHTGIES